MVSMVEGEVMGNVIPAMTAARKLFLGLERGGVEIEATKEGTRRAELSTRKRRGRKNGRDRKVQKVFGRREPAS